MNFKVIKSNIVFEGKVFSVKVDDIQYNGSGNLATRQVAVHPGGAVVLPLKSNGKIIFVKQFRYPHNEFVIELPAGKLDKGEDPQKCALRELKEETGYSSEKVIKLGKIYTTPGFCNEVLHIFLAENLIDGEHAREEGEEDMELLEMTLEEAEEKILKGEIVDAKTISGLMMLKLHYKNE
ncbi:NUDIX hydrolase [Melioribacter sp. OK-6-Me]|uniref:NUDIX hydrolase n=1 Tax=unclassified Melioribacter TaxID=2627329 RepID=UPI003ED873B0